MTTSNSLVSSFLAHYGVKGMKWGIRKDRRSNVKTSRKRKPSRSTENVSPDSKRAAKLKTKRASQLTNAELKRLNERMNLEQNYRRLMASEASKTPLQKGQAFVKGAIDVARTGQDIYNLANSPAGKAARQAITQQIRKR